MTSCGGIVETVVVIDEIGLERRFVLRPHQIDRVALQAVDDELLARLQTGDDRGIARVAELFAGAPQRASAHQTVDRAVRAIAIADGKTTVVVAEVRRKADRILLRDRMPKPGARWIVGPLQSEAQHAVLASCGQRHIVVRPRRRTTLRDNHVVLIVEHDV